MYLVTIPITAEFDGNTYNLPYNLIAHNTQYELPFNYYYDYSDGGTRVGVPSGRLIQDIINIIRYDFRQITYYSTNRANNIRFDDMTSFLTRILNEFNINLIPLQTSNAPQNFRNVKLSNGAILSSTIGPSVLTSNMIISANCPNGNVVNIQTFENGNCFIRIDLLTIPYRSISEQGFDIDSIRNSARNIIITSNGELTAQNNISWNNISVTIQQAVIIDSLVNDLETINSNLDEIADDIDYINVNINPYDTGVPSGIGGGDGDYGDPDEIDKIGLPSLPNISALTTGLLTIYAPTLSQLQSLGNYLWSDLFDIDTLKKMFSDPMQSIIGLGIVPIKPVVAGTKTVKFGNVSTDVSMPYINNQFVEKSCGSVSIKKYIGSFMDYSPYTQIQIYLPYIGIKSLSPDDVMNDTLSVIYHIDVLTGGCAAILSTANKGVLYQYNGNCIANVPLTAINYGAAIQNAVSAVGNIATAAVGMATGAAPLTAMGVMGLATNAANTAINSKPVVEHSGNMGGAAGMLSVQKPYLIITRPRLSTPQGLNSFGGYPSNVNMRLSTCEGFTMVDSIHLDKIPCTDNERNELFNILKGGVIF